MITVKRSALFRLFLLILVAAVLPYGVGMPTQAASGAVITVANASNMAEAHRLGRGIVRHATFTPDGEKILAASTIGVWIYEAAALNTPTEPTYFPTKARVRTVAGNSANTQMAVAMGAIVEFWTSAGEVKGTFDAKSEVTTIAYSPDGAFLAVGVYQKVFLIDATSFAQKAELVLKGAVYGTVFSLDGKVLYVASGEPLLRAFSTSTYEEVGSAKTQGNDIRVLALSADGTRLATGTQNKIVQIWNTADFTEAAQITLVQANGVYGLSFSPNGEELAIAGTNIRLYFVSAKGGETQESEANEPRIGTIQALQYSKDGKNVLLSGFNSDGAVLLWGVQARTLSSAVQAHTREMLVATFSPDSKHLLFGGASRSVGFWDTESNDALNTTKQIPDVFAGGSSENQTAALIAPDGSFGAAVSGYDVQLFDPKTGAKGITLKSGSRFVGVTLAISPDSTLIAFGLDDGIRIYEAKTGSLLATLVGHTASVRSLAFSPDQTMLASASYDGTVRIWRVK